MIMRKFVCLMDYGLSAAWDAKERSGEVTEHTVDALL